MEFQNFKFGTKVSLTKQLSSNLNKLAHPVPNLSSFNSVGMNDTILINPSIPDTVREGNC